jgi:hypothetical protein
MSDFETTTMLFPSLRSFSKCSLKAFRTLSPVESYALSPLSQGFLSSSWEMICFAGDYLEERVEEML